MPLPKTKTEWFFLLLSIPFLIVLLLFILGVTWPFLLFIKSEERRRVVYGK